MSIPIIIRFLGYTTLSSFFVTPGFAQCCADRYNDGEHYQRGELLFHEDFSSGSWEQNWVIETQTKEEKVPEQRVEKGIGFLSAPAGQTAWLKPVFEGDLLIEARIRVPSEGPYARVSDMNFFWMATDPAKASDVHDIFGRDGDFKRYHDLSLYYAGIGGNGGRNVRFRKVHAFLNGVENWENRPVLQERKEPEHKLKGDHWYKVDIRVEGNRIRFLLDGETIFDYTDPEPLREGRFGLRQYKSMKQVDYVRVTRLEHHGDTD